MNYWSKNMEKNNKNRAITLAEMMIVVVIVAIISAVFLAMPKKNVTKMDTSKYYIAYNALKRLQDEQMAQNGTVNLNQFKDQALNWLNTQSSTVDSITLSNGMIITWANSLHNAANENCDDTLEDSGCIFKEPHQYLRVFVDIDGDTSTGNNKDTYIFHLFDNGWVRPDMCYKSDSTTCSENDANNVNIVLPFKVYSFKNDGSVENLLINADYNTAYNLYRCSNGLTSASDNSCDSSDCKGRDCIMEAIPPLK